jgi:hypothetical protein
MRMGDGSVAGHVVLLQDGTVRHAWSQFLVLLYSRAFVGHKYAQQLARYNCTT